MSKVSTISVKSSNSDYEINTDGDKVFDIEVHSKYVYFT